MTYLIKEEDRHCLSCGEELYGRPDKKFCCEECKNRYHNERRLQDNRISNRIITDLMRNKKILTMLADSGKEEADIVELEAMGFRVSRITGYRKSASGPDEYDCLDFRFCLEEGRLIRLRRVRSLQRAAQQPWEHPQE